MKAKFACKDAGFECAFQTEAATTEELMPKIVEHAKTVHGMETIPEDVKAKVAAGIKIEE